MEEDFPWGGGSLFTYSFRHFEKELAGGGWRPTATKIQQKMLLLLIWGQRKKGAEKKPWIYGMGGISLRQPPLSANPFSKPLTVGPFLTCSWVSWWNPTKVAKRRREISRKNDSNMALKISHGRWYKTTTKEWGVEFSNSSKQIRGSFFIYSKRASLLTVHWGAS